MKATAAVVVISLLMGGLIWLILSSSDSKIDGSVVAEGGGALGNWTFKPDICESGGRRFFFGARFFSSADGKLALSYSDDPGNGPVLISNIPGGTHGLRFRQSDCSTLEAHIQNGMRVNNIVSVSGDITLDCTLEGSHLKGRLDFENCH